jgi:hypothetical protein
VADDFTSGEVRRTLERIQDTQKDAHRAIDDRISELARKTVPAEVHAAEMRAVNDDVKHLDSDMHDAVALIERTSQERMATLRSEIAGVRTDAAGVRKAQAKHEENHRDLGQWSRTKKLAVTVALIGASATLIAVWIAAILAAKGVR